MKYWQQAGKFIHGTINGLLRSQIGYNQLLGSNRQRFQNLTLHENSRNARIGALGMIILNGSAAVFFLIGLGGPAIKPEMLQRLFSIYPHRCIEHRT